MIISLCFTGADKSSLLVCVIVQVTDNVYSLGKSPFLISRDTGERVFFVCVLFFCFVSVQNLETGV